MTWKCSMECMDFSLAQFLNQMIFNYITQVVSHAVEIQTLIHTEYSLT